MNSRAWLPMLLGLVSLLLEPALNPRVPAAVEAEPGLQEVLEHIRIKASMVTSLRGRFRQETQTRLLSGPVHSAGQVYWQSPNRLRWEVTTPDPMTLVARGGSILVLYPDLKRASTYQVPARGDILGRLSGTAGDVESLQRDYRITITLVSGGGKRFLQMTFDPATDRSARYLKRLEIKIDPGDWLPREVKILESDREITTIHLLDLTENVELPANLFNVDPPVGFFVDGVQRTDDRFRP